ncbi:MAG: S8 family peptidase [Pseudomonadota bacterium]
MHAAGGTGDGVRVAIVDSGISPTEQLPDARIQGFDFQGSGGTSSGFNVDDGDHGTGVASLVGAANDDRGAEGGAPDAEIYSYNYIDEGPVRDAELTAVFERHITDGIDVSNNSWGINAHMVDDAADLFRFYPNATDAAQRAVAAGTIFVWSAGNSDGAVADYLSGMPHNIAGLEDQWLLVVATDSSNRQTDFSNICGPAASFCVAAPGERVRVTRSDGEAGLASGTSFSAPLVSATLANLIDLFPTLTPAQIVDRVTATATYDGLTARNDCTASSCTTAQMQEQVGHGLVDGAAAASVIGTTEVRPGGPAVSRSALAVPTGLGSRAKAALMATPIVVYDSFDGAEFDSALSDLVAGDVAVAARGYSSRSRQSLQNETQPMAPLTFTLSHGPTETSDHEARFWGTKLGLVEDDLSDRSVAPSLDGALAVTETTTLYGGAQLVEAAPRFTLGTELKPWPGAAVQLGFSSGEEVVTLNGAEGERQTREYRDTISLAARQALGEVWEVFGHAALIAGEDRAAGFAEWGHREARFATATLGIEHQVTQSTHIALGGYVPEQQIAGDATLILGAPGGTTSEHRFDASGIGPGGLFVAARLEGMNASDVATISIQQHPGAPTKLAHASLSLSFEF